MKRLVVMLLALQFVFGNTFATIAFADAVGEEVPQGVTLPRSTPVYLMTKEIIKAESVQEGDIVIFEVARDVEVENIVLIRAGAHAEGTVVGAEEARRLGRAGKIELTVDYAEAVDGSKVLLRGSKDDKGKSRIAGAAALSAIICPIFLLMKGKEATIPAGSEFKTYTATDYKF